MDLDRLFNAIQISFLHDSDILWFIPLNACEIFSLKCLSLSLFLTIFVFYYFVLLPKNICGLPDLQVPPQP